MRRCSGTVVEPPKAGLVAVSHSQPELAAAMYRSTQIIRTPHSPASLSKYRELHRVPNMGPMKRMAGRLVISKLVVVEYVTLSLA